MIINLAEVTFINDFFTIGIPDGGLLILNKLNESLLTDDMSVLEVNRINIEVSYSDRVRKCSSVIGMGNDLLQIKSAYSDLIGSVLTEETMDKCEIEVYE